MKTMLAFLLATVTGCSTIPVTDNNLGSKKIVLADVQAALTSAESQGDTAAVACYKALIPLANGSEEVSQVAGALSAFQAARHARRTIQAGIPEAVHNACAPLILDAQKTLLGLGLLVK